jgi:hypothetical protein
MLLTRRYHFPNNTDSLTEFLPFTPGDITAGTENELQALVVGKRTTVDLPISIERSKYYANIARRVAIGEASNDLIRELQAFLSDNDDQVWENSWVRFPRKYLSSFASELLERDLTSTRDEMSEPRSDRGQFVFATNWGEWVRVPISYLVKLALADVLGKQPALPLRIKQIALGLLPHFSNDLTSPETFSFHGQKGRRSGHQDLRAFPATLCRHIYRCSLPARISDFHPERALGFLPHELDYTHLRMLWRHWKRKTNFLGQ